MLRESEFALSLPREWLLTPNFGKQVLGIIDTFGGLNTKKVSEGLTKANKLRNNTSFPPDFNPHSLKDVREILLNLESRRLIMHITDPHVGDFWALSTKGSRFLEENKSSVYMETFERETQEEKEGILKRESERMQMIEENRLQQLKDREETKRLERERREAAKRERLKVREERRQEKQKEIEKRKAKRQEEREKRQRKSEREKNKKRREREKIRRQKRREKKEERKRLEDVRRIAREARETEKATLKKLKEDERLRLKEERQAQRHEKKREKEDKKNKELLRNQKADNLVQLGNDFGSRVKAWRKYCGLKQKDILDHKDNSYVSAIETGRIKAIKKETALKIAQKLGISLEDLLSEDFELPEIPAPQPLQPTPFELEEIAQVASLQREASSAHPLPRSGIIFVGVKESGIRSHENGFVRETNPEKLVELGAPKIYGKGDVFIFANEFGEEYTLLQDRMVRVRYRTGSVDKVPWKRALIMIGQTNFVSGLQNAVYGKPKIV